MSEDDWEPYPESGSSDDESRGQSDGAGSSMGSDSSKNEQEWQAESELPRPAGTQNLWLVEDHTTGDEVRQVRSKSGASHPDPSTVFGKHCECIAQKCTHLERPPPLTGHSLPITYYC